MISRRHFLHLGAAALAATPAVASAHSSKPFVLEDRFMPQIVTMKRGFDIGEIVVEPRNHYLYLILERHRALRYGVGVGKAGLEFKGHAIIERKAKWPSWRPTRAMIARDPGSYAKYARGVPGGPNNPLGARALYLYRDGIDTYFRIHGTTQPWSIGQSVSNGCIRMLNDHVEDLYDRVPVGTPVTVL